MSAGSTASRSTPAAKAGQWWKLSLDTWAVVLALGTLFDYHDVVILRASDEDARRISADPTAQLRVR